jgi:hypothetical protein
MLMLLHPSNPASQQVFSAALDPLLVSEVRNERASVSVVNAGSVNNTPHILDGGFGASRGAEMRGIGLELGDHVHQLLTIFFRLCSFIRLSRLIVTLCTYEDSCDRCRPFPGRWLAQGPHHPGIQLGTWRLQCSERLC